MADLKRGISLDLLIHPGETISDVLEDRNITQKELAKRAGVSEPFLSDVIRGKKDISKGLAMGLEYALGVPKSFWLNLQANYDAELLSITEEQSITDQERTVFQSIQEIVHYLKTTNNIPCDSTENQAIISLRKNLRISNLCLLKTMVPLRFFRSAEETKFNSDLLGAWLCLCEAQQQPAASFFDEFRIQDLILSLKNIMQRKELDPSSSLMNALSEYGIQFSTIQSFRDIPIQGILRKNENTYQLVLTRYETPADDFWSLIFRQIGHMVNKDIKKNGMFITIEDLANINFNKTNEFSANSLLDANSYKQFLENHKFTISSIEQFAKSQNVPSYIVIGRLQREGIIPFNKFEKYKLKYKWT
ncbi:MAG: HigA family addiction module antidote protein [Faecalicoccus sp.]|nr:HigA family addiction module antidote protein [Faecalicoccus sp.]